MARGGGARAKDMTKEPPFGKLTVLRRDGSTARGQAAWRCRCECGNEVTVPGNSLRTRNTKSCGCLREEASREAHTTHGMSRSRTYHIWQSMMRRCYEEDFLGYENYGGRGIVVEGRWYTFENFVRDMGECPAGLTLDRIDTEKGYGPDNCRWADQKTQTRNRRATVMVEHGGQKKSLAEWAELLGLGRQLLYTRIFVHSWPVEKAFTTPAMKARGPNRPGKQTQKDKARHAVHVAVRTGRMAPASRCQHPGCEAAKVEAHHHRGYEPEHALDVVWFCRKHHPKPSEKTLTFDGQTRTLREWSERTGVPRLTLYHRLKKSGWVATAETFRPVQKPGRMLTLGGVTKNVTEWSKEIGFSVQAILKRLSAGLPMEDVLRPSSLRRRPQEDGLTPPGPGSGPGGEKSGGR
jgi:hypothetical protein